MIQIFILLLFSLDYMWNSWESFGLIIIIDYNFVEEYIIYFLFKPLNILYFFLSIVLYL